MTSRPPTLVLIGRVHSPLEDRASAPKQGSEGAPAATLVIEAPFASGLSGLEPGQDVLVLTWLHEGRRDVLAIHPRDDPARPLTGVFATRSEDRPNPIGVHRVTVLSVSAAGRLEVAPLEAIDGTPVLDIKPVLRAER